MDIGWRTCGVSAEIAAVVAEKAFKYLKAPVKELHFLMCRHQTARFLKTHIILTIKRIVIVLWIWLIRGCNTEKVFVSIIMPALNEEKIFLLPLIIH